MLEQHRMPAEYQDFWSIVLCNDCEKKSKTRYHFLYHKCQECSSYNTKLLQTVQEVTPAQGDAPAISVPVSTAMLQSTSTASGDARARSTSNASGGVVPDDNESRNNS
jgi:hypothetical protein